jgi:hypothetical protein
MTILNDYESIVTDYCKDKDKFINNNKCDYESQVLRLLIYCLKFDFISYKQELERFDIEKVEKNSMEYFIFLEGRIRYIAYTSSGKVYKEKKSALVTQFLELCEKSLSLFPYAFIASTEIALRMESQKDYENALSIMKKTYDHGFRSKNTLYSIILVSSQAHRWDVAINYLIFIEPKWNKSLMNLFILYEKYGLLRLVFGFICLFFMFLKYWYFIFISLCALCFTILFFGLHYKNRAEIKLSLETLLSIVVSIILGLGVRVLI